MGSGEAFRCQGLVRVWPGIHLGDLSSLRLLPLLGDLDGPLYGPVDLYVWPYSTEGLACSSSTNYLLGPLTDHQLRR